MSSFYSIVILVYLVRKHKHVFVRSQWSVYKIYLSSEHSCGRCWFTDSKNNIVTLVPMWGPYTLQLIGTGLWYIDLIVLLRIRNHFLPHGSWLTYSNLMYFLQRCLEVLILDLGVLILVGGWEFYETLKWKHFRPGFWGPLWNFWGPCAVVEGIQ